MALCAASLAGCATNAGICDGWEKENPTADTRAYIIKNDRPFAESVAGNLDFGRAKGCWK